jgi:DNA-binding MurR/RpiR family transcriptional regulator
VNKSKAGVKVGPNKRNNPQPDIVQAIRDRYQSLSDSHKLVADYVLDNLEAAALLSVNDLAGKIGTSDATLIRFAKEVGYGGYKEMREHLADYIRKIIYAQKPSLHGPKAHSGILNKIKELDTAYIASTMDSVDPARFSRLIREITRAGRVFCMGWRISSFLAEFLSFQLRRLGWEAHPILRERRSLLEQVLDLRQNDLLIVFDLLLYSSEVYQAVSYLGQQKNAPKIVTITNDPLAQIVQYADLSFFLDLSGQRDFSIISLSAPMCLINAMVEEVIAADPERANQALSLYESEVLTRGGHAMGITPRPK